MSTLRTAAAVSAALVAAGATPASSEQARPMTAGELASFCKSTDLAVHNACKFFILGAFQGASVAQGKICLPDNLSSDQMEFLVRDSLARDLEFYPDDSKLMAIGVVGAVMMKNYGCGQGRSAK